jgi:hypothetical protein
MQWLPSHPLHAKFKHIKKDVRPLNAAALKDRGNGDGDKRRAPDVASCQ